MVDCVDDACFIIVEQIADLLQNDAIILWIKNDDETDLFHEKIHTKKITANKFTPMIAQLEVWRHPGRRCLED